MELVRHPVHRALTRPQMFAGVTYNFFIINAAVTTELFLITGSFVALLAALVIHCAGYFACLREPRVFDFEPQAHALHETPNVVLMLQEPLLHPRVHVGIR